MLVDISIFLQILRYIMYGKMGENENFCVKLGLNEDHFTILVLMRTKSSIEDLCASSGYYINGRYFIQISQNGDMIYCRT